MEKELCARGHGVAGFDSHPTRRMHLHAAHVGVRKAASAARVASGQLGVASATKRCRSVMIKGLEACVIESFTTARHYGVEDAVIASLQETFHGIGLEHAQPPHRHSR